MSIVNAERDKNQSRWQSGVHRAVHRTQGGHCCPSPPFRISGAKGGMNTGPQCFSFLKFHCQPVYDTSCHIFSILPKQYVGFLIPGFGIFSPKTELDLSRNQDLRGQYKTTTSSTTTTNCCRSLCTEYASGPRTYTEHLYMQFVLLSHVPHHERLCLFSLTQRVSISEL